MMMMMMVLICDDDDGDDDDDDEDVDVDVEEEEEEDDDDDDDVEQEDVEEKNGSQDWEAHSARTSAVENAHGHVTRAILCENLKGIGRPGYYLDSTLGLNTYSKNPSVWPHCLGEIGGIFASPAKFNEHK